MKIQLKNFNNLKDFSYEVQNKKINFLFGISGSGKSSISKSFNANDFSKYVSAGKPVESCSVTLTDKPFDDGDIVPVYDYNYMDNILILKTNQTDMYSIVFAGEEALENYRNTYNKYLADLKNFRERLVLLVDRINTLISKLKIGFINGGANYKSTCLIRKYEGTIETKGSNTLAHKYAGKRAQWFADGMDTDDYRNNKCPFCAKKLSDKRKELVEKITNIDIASFNKINDQSPIFTELRIDLPNWSSKKSTNSFKKKLFDLINSTTDINNIIELIDACYKTDFDVSSVHIIKFNKKLKELYPELEIVVNSFNESLVDVKKILGKIKNKTHSIISTNIRTINGYLDRFSIPYVFEKIEIDQSGKTAQYLLKHKNDSVSIERNDNLSFGEKNIIGLIFFLLANKKKKMIVIDDPASSFDNFRRKIILDLIFELKNPSSTILILSHDEVFIKIALLFAGKSAKKSILKADMSEVEKKYSKEIGKTTFIENNSKSSLCDISMDDFDSLSYFIRKRLLELTHEINYQTAILIRLLYETITHKNKQETLVYGYLSSIIHEKPYSEIMECLSSKSASEKKILKDIFTKTKIAYHKLSSDYINKRKSFTYNDFEFAALFRETLKESKDKQKKVIKSELNSIVHLSSNYITCLNPFKYRLYSNTLHDFLDNEKQLWFSTN